MVGDSGFVCREGGDGDVVHKGELFDDLGEEEGGQGEGKRNGLEVWNGDGDGNFWVIRVYRMAWGNAFSVSSDVKILHTKQRQCHCCLPQQN